MHQFENYNTNCFFSEFSITGIEGPKSGGHGMPQSRIGSTKWSAKRTLSINSRTFEWKICVACVCHSCASAGIASSWWWKNSVSYTTHQWLHLFRIHRCGPTLSITKCRIHATVSTSIVHRVVIQAYGKWWWTSWKRATTIVAWSTVVHRIWVAMRSTKCCITISNVIIRRIGPRTACTFTQRGSRGSKNTWMHTCVSWTTWQKCKTSTLWQTIRQFSGCGSQHRLMHWTNSNRGIARANSLSRRKFHAICRTRANCTVECCNRIDSWTPATNVRLNIRGFATNSVSTDDRTIPSETITWKYLIFS